MHLFLGAPYRALIAASRRAWGGTGRVLAPSSVARGVGATSHLMGDWHGFLHALTGIAPVVQPSPEMVALLGEVCEQVLTATSYFGKVRLSPRFHSALAHSFCRWSADGLTPARLQQGADAVRTRYASLAELDDAELQEEWQRKTTELARLWRAWQGALHRAGVPEPIQRWQQLLEALPAVASVPPLLLVGFTELTVMEIEVLRLLDERTPVALVLPAEPGQPDAYAPVASLRQQLRHFGIPLQEAWLELSPPPSSEPSITLLDTPNPLHEVETVAREILKLQASGIAPDEIALIVRQPEAVLETLEVVFTRYGIPLQGEVGLPLERSWRVRWAMDGLRLLAGAGTGEQWLRWLAHPAHALGFEAWHAFQTRVRRHLGATPWLEHALQHATDTDLNRLLRELSALRLHLPANLPHAARALALRLGIREPLADADADLSVWLGLIDAYADRWRRQTPAQAVELLERLVSGARYTHRLGNQGVRLMPVECADLVGARVAFVLQVLEGVLPRRHPDDPFLREAERHALNHALSTERIYLPTRAERQAGEPMLWRRLLHAAHQRIYFSYSRTQGDEGDALPSFYLETLKAERPAAVQTRFYSLEQIAPDEEDSLHPYDQSLRTPQYHADPPPLIRHAALRQRIATLNRPFSVTELETLVRCPFEHFARYLLRLRPLQRELSVRHVGSLTHAALCRGVRQPPTSPHTPNWGETLSRCLRDLLSRESPDLPEWQIQVLHALAERLLRRFSWREPLYQAQFGMQPVACEWAFGDANADDEERGRGTASPQRAARAISYRLNNGQQIALCGVIDRIDLSPDRRVALVLDYKLGSAPTLKEFREGRAIQGLLYLHAVRAVLPNAEVVLAYDRLKAGRRVRFVPNHPTLIQRFKRLEWEENGDCYALGLSQWQSAAQKLRALLTEAIAKLQAAHIEPTPGEHCRRCAFSDLCRCAAL